MKRQLWVTGFVMLALLAGSSLLEAKTVTLNFLWPNYTPAKVRYGEYLVQEFEKANPDIKVNMIQTNNPYDQLALLTAAGTPPDVGWLGTRWSEFAEQGFLLGLDQLVERDKRDVDAVDFIPNIWNQYRWRGKQAMVPTGFTLTVLFYNKNRYAEAGLNNPTDAWTWEQMVSQSKKMTKDASGDGVPEQWGMNLFHGSEWSVYAYNGPFFLDEGAKASYTTPGFIWGLGAWWDLLYKDKVHPTAAQATAAGGHQPMWLSGNLGIYAGGSWALEPSRKEIAGFDWDIVPMPHKSIEGVDRRGTFMGPEGLYVHANSQIKEEAWRFVKFCTGRPMSEWAAREGHVIPARRTVLGSRAFLNAADKPANIIAYGTSADFGVIYSQHPMWGQISAAITPLLRDQQAATPTRAPRAAAEEMQRLAQQIITEWLPKRK